MIDAATKFDTLASAVAPSSASTAVETALSFLRSRDSAKAALLEEMQVLRSRLLQVEAILSELGAPSTARPLAPNDGGTVPELVSRALLGASGGLTIGQIVKVVQIARPSLKPSSIYPAVYKLRGERKLRCHEQNGEKLYTLTRESGLTRRGA